MLTRTQKPMSIYVDRQSQQWVVRDGEGQFWVLPQTEQPWMDRRPFQLTEDVELESIPGHYRFLLGLPN
jgi:hypothetical protein